MISLVNRSHFSLMRATASAKELVKDAKNKGWKALAITDRDNLYGLWAFLKACEDNWIIPIIGVEVSCPKSSSCSILLAQNQEGYGNLCKITTDRKMSKEFQCAESFIKNQKGLVFLISCPKLLTDLNHKLKHIFALIRHRPSKENESLRNIAQSLKVPLVAAPAPYFLEPEDYSVHKVLRAISQNQSLSRLNPEELCPDYAFLPNTENFKKNFTMYPEAISNINKVFNLISLRKPQNQIILPPWSGHEHACLELKKRAFAGAKTRYGSINQEIKNRLVHELKIIHKKQFCSYFLVV